MGIVYHYTDTQAFKGIVENAQVWATDFRYLNDSLELVYTWKAFVEKLRELAAQPGDYSEAFRAQLEALTLMNAIDLMQFDDAMFVACFTELPDAVSQWMGYGAKGYGVALGFDSDRITALKVPQYHHTPGGKLVPVTAILSGGPSSGQRIDVEWGAFLQQVAYGDTARDRVVDGLIDTVQRICDKNGVGTFNHKVGNCILQTHGLVHRLPLVKHSDFEYEREHRITITEHLSGKRLSQLRALKGLGKPFSDFAQGALETVNVQFRPDESRMFKPYVPLPFDREALVEVVTGPAVKHQLVEATARGVLDRNGFLHNKIRASQSPLQV